MLGHVFARKYIREVTHAMNNVLKIIEQVLFYLFSWIAASAFLILFFNNVDVSKPSNIGTLYYLFLILGLAFTFLPFMKKVSIGKLLELERNVKETKNEVKEFKNEVSQILSIVSTTINTISNNNNTVNINIPGIDEIAKAKEKLLESTDENTLKSATKIKDDLIMEDEDLVMALARTRIRIEYLLRHIIDKLEPQQGNVILNYRPLFRKFKELYPQFANMEEPFSYTMSMCSAAIHSHYLPRVQAEEALDMGSKLIAVLVDIDKKNN